MNKIFDIALKEMRHSFRSKGAIIFMFAIPILVTVLFSFMFGGIANSEDEAYALPATAVILVNLDEGNDQTGLDFGEFDSMGAVFADMLANDELATLLTVTTLQDAPAAKTAVDEQEAGVAIIIPPDFTTALTGDSKTSVLPTAVVELYTDPTLTLGPAIVESIVRQFVDRVAASNIGIGLTLEQLATAGVAITPELINDIVAQYTTPQAATAVPLVSTLSPQSDTAEDNALADILSLILAGMMVFYAFFTGANVLQSILTEEERGTLQRLFTTPTPHLIIFSGKFVAALMILVVQISVLLLFGWLAFDIAWGTLPAVILAGIGLVVISATTGLFVVSLLKNSRQAGVMFGGLLTITGMMGMISVFTAGAPYTPPALNTLSLTVPQGWAIRGIQQAMDGRSLADIGLTLLVTLLWSAVFFYIGQRRLQKRFA